MNILSSTGTRCCVCALILVALIACKSSPDQSAGRTPVSTADTTKGMAGMQGMQGMNGSASMMAAGTMDSMRAEMGRMRGMNGDRMKAEMPAHRQVTANMLSQMNADMRGMNMTGDPAWNSLVDSLRRDLVDLPNVPAARLPAALPPHLARVERLMTMHQRMMKR